jgi:hypothetical protein
MLRAGFNLQSLIKKHIFVAGLLTDNSKNDEGYERARGYI